MEYGVWSSLRVTFVSLHTFFFGWVQMCVYFTAASKKPKVLPTGERIWIVGGMVTDWDKLNCSEKTQIKWHFLYH